uniref:Uncharacterized protein n=1 Tax=Clytia hemisphaerica TaxID=252671 RepID=A0A7M6DRE0_9CNID
MSDSSPDHNSNTNEQLRNIVNNMQKQIDALTSSQTSSKRPTPQQGIDTSPQRDYYEEEDEDMEFNELDFDEELELYASQNEDFENEIEENTSSKTKDDTPSAVPTSIQVQNEPSTSTQDDDIFSDIRIVSTEEDKGEKIKDDFARIILDSYNSKKDKENIKKLRQSYPLPENCNIPVPKLNVELWQLLNSFQRKSDVSMAMIQRNLISALSGVIKIIKNVLNEDANKKELVQISSDIAGLIGQASKDIAFKRKLFIKSALKDEFRLGIHRRQQQTN